MVSNGCFGAMSRPLSAILGDLCPSLPFKRVLGERRTILRACHDQLRNRSLTFNLISGLWAPLPRFFSRVKLQSVGGFFKIVFNQELPDCPSLKESIHSVR